MRLTYHRRLASQRANAPTMAVSVNLERTGDLVKGEPETLRCLDHTQHRHRLGWIQPLAAECSVSVRRANPSARSSAAPRRTILGWERGRARHHCRLAEAGSAAGDRGDR